jgi:hypothetical protein
MNISKTHKEFADQLQFRYNVPKQDVLNYPEKYFGPNSEAVINFWLYLDILSKDQLKVVQKRYDALSDEELGIDCVNVYKDPIFIIDHYDAAHSAFSSVSCVNDAEEYATYELINLQKLLEQGHQPVFFPMFLNL